MCDQLRGVGQVSFKKMFGEYGIYTTTLLGSTDVTTHVVSLVPAEARLFDFGHADLFLATDAPVLVWQPILSWLQTH